MSSPVVTEDQIVEALRPVEDPELHRSIVDLGMLRGVSIMDNGVVGVLVALTVPGCPLKDEITRRVLRGSYPTRRRRIDRSRVHRDERRRP